MSAQRREPAGDQPGGRFTLEVRAEAEGELSGPDRYREERLAETLAEIGVCLSDGAELVSMGKQRFDSDWLVRRAAKNIVTEFAETANRLPKLFKQAHPETPWKAISGMRNRVVHVYENTDPEIVWNVLTNDFPAIRRQLGIG